MQNEEANAKLVKWGWITTLLIAPVGAIIGIVLLTRNKVGHGVAMLVVCVAWMTVGWAIIDSTSQGAEMGDMESAIKSDLDSQVSATGVTVESVSCARDTDTHATCFAETDEPASYGIDVTIDQNSGEYIWQVQ